MFIKLKSASKEMGEHVFGFKELKCFLFLFLNIKHYYNHLNTQCISMMLRTVEHFPYFITVMGFWQNLQLKIFWNPLSNSLFISMNAS